MMKATDLKAQQYYLGTLSTTLYYMSLIERQDDYLTVHFDYLNDGYPSWYGPSKATYFAGAGAGHSIPLREITVEEAKAICAERNTVIRPSHIVTSNEPKMTISRQTTETAAINITDVTKAEISASWPNDEEPQVIYITFKPQAGREEVAAIRLDVLLKAAEVAKRWKKNA